MEKTLRGCALTAFVSGITLTLFSIIVFLLMFSSCSVSFDQTGYPDGLAVHYGSLSSYAFAGEYTVEEPIDELVINVPDSYEGHPVKQLGGYYGMGVPTPFGAYFSYQHFYHSYYFSDTDIIDICSTLPSESRWVSGSDATIIPVTITVNIGRIVSSVDGPNHPTVSSVSSSDGQPAANACIYLPIDTAEEHIFYLPVYYFNCSEDNRTFYSEEGRLYYRENDELVNTFTYWDSELLEYIPLSDE